MYSIYRYEDTLALSNYVADQSDNDLPLPDEIMVAYSASKKRSEDCDHCARVDAYRKSNQLMDAAKRQFNEAVKLMKERYHAVVAPVEEAFQAECGPIEARFAAVLLALQDKYLLQIQRFDDQRRIAEAQARLQFCNDERNHALGTAISAAISNYNKAIAPFHTQWKGSEAVVEQDRDKLLAPLKERHEAFLESSRHEHFADLKRLRLLQDDAIGFAHKAFTDVCEEAEARRNLEAVKRLTALNQYSSALRLVLSDLSEIGSPAGK
jgi:hypothetical protein